MTVDEYFDEEGIYEGNRLKNDVRRDLKQKQANEQHIQDLQFRLDMIAGNAKAKGARQPIGSTLPFNVQAKRQAKLDAKSRDNQFKGYRSLTTRQSESYLKNGMYLPK